MKASKKALRNLARRQAAFPGGASKEFRYQPPSGGGSQTYHRPGSQSRAK